VLTDIIGAEDHYGDMDFKICGTREGITAFQLDLKIHGLPIAIAKEAIAQNKVTRDHILDIMGKVMPATRPELKPCAPRTHRLKIPSDKIGALIGPGNALGSRVGIDEAEAHLFGLVLFNDWSARDIQPWEYQPLGPFLSKNWGSTVSPWVVTMEALAPFRVPFTRPADHPQPLPYLDSTTHRAHGALSIQLETWLQTSRMRKEGFAGERLMGSDTAEAAYWSLAQLITHHTVGGCNLRTGDLLGTGTLSGPGPGQGGSMLELSQGGKVPVTLANGETRTFLEDGDTVILRAYCEAQGAVRIGLGEVAGTVLPAQV
jgi:fumarylacetoacetase